MEHLKTFFILIILIFFDAAASASEKFNISSESGVVDIVTVNKNIKVKMIYSTTDNFLDRDIYGDFDSCYLREEVAGMLSKAQVALDENKKGYSLIVYDCLRPRNVQYAMWRVVEGTEGQGYVANPVRGSIHNYGAAVDLSIVDDKGVPLEMGTKYDFFGKLAQPRHEEKFLKEGKLTQDNIDNRKLLYDVMEGVGFKGISNEWWHFNAYPNKLTKEKFDIVEYLLPEDKINTVLKESNEMVEKSDVALIFSALDSALYVVKGGYIQQTLDVKVNRSKGYKVPVGDYKVRRVLSAGVSTEGVSGCSAYAIAKDKHGVEMEGMVVLASDSKGDLGKGFDSCLLIYGVKDFSKKGLDSISPVVGSMSMYPEDIKRFNKEIKIETPLKVIN